MQSHMTHRRDSLPAIRLHSFARNLRSGIVLGLYIATGLSLWATLIRLIGGLGPFEATGTPYGRTIVLYYVGCVLGGSLLGALLPLRRWALGSMLLGILFVMPIYGTFAFVRASQSDQEAPWRITGLLVASILAGGVLGFYAWSHEQRRK